MIHSPGMPIKMQRLAALVEKINALGGKAAGLQTMLGKYNFLLLCDLVGKERFENTISCFQQLLREPNRMPIASPVDAVCAETIERYRPEMTAESGPAPQAPMIAKLPRRIAVCCCVSGQLRGYEDGARQLRGLFADDIDVAVVVHTWKHIGGQRPLGRELTAAEIANPHSQSRNFRGEFLGAYNAAVDRFGWEGLQDFYPNFVGYISRSGDASVAQLKEIYGTNDVVVDDENEEPFKDQLNQWKMLYKIQKCHELGRARVPNADLYLRIRPDRSMTQPFTFDCESILYKSEKYRRIFVDAQRRMGHLGFIGDQLAIGTAEVMDEYSIAFQKMTDVFAGRSWSQCRTFIGHQALAYRTFEAGLSVEEIPTIYHIHRLNNSDFSNADMLREIRKDAAMRPMTDLDGILMAALETDMSNE